VGKRYLADSNAIIDFFKESLPVSGIEFMSAIEPLISIITFIELFANVNASEEEIKELQNFCSAATVYNINIEIAAVTIELRKKYKIKLPDALIAATALHYNLVLITRDVFDFKKIDGLQIITPHLI